MKLTREQIAAYDKLTYSNALKVKELASPVNCGCLMCGAVFTSDMLNPEMEYEEADGSRTLVCPFCEYDSVLVEDSDVSVTKELVEAILTMTRESNPAIMVTVGEDGKVLTSPASVGYPAGAAVIDIPDDID